MSHTTFAFLVTCDPDQTPETAGEEALATFQCRYAEDLCDENNWWTEETLILKSGCVVPLCSAGDWRGRDTLQKHFAALPPEQRWTEALRHCLLAAAYRLGIEGTVNFRIGLTPEPANRRFAEKARAMSVEELTRHIRGSMLTVTAEALEKASAALRAEAVAGLPGAAEPSLSASMSVWPAQEALDAYSSASATSLFPFTPFLSNPYHNWCCYDIRDNQDDDEQAGILFVDIHT